MKKLLQFLIATSIALFAYQKKDFGQSPDLGTASSFSLFTAVGAFGNSGESVIANDVGTNAGLFTGFPPGTVEGTIHVIDAVSANAAIDVNTAYTYLKNLPADSIIASSLGENQVLFPNVYSIITAATLGGDLYLDGQGEPNAQFIFQIDGALFASANCNIIPINSASLNNVYWQVNGEFNLGSGSFFTGSVINNGAINLFESAIIQGRALSTDGAINLVNNIVDMIMQPMNPLSIELLGFIAYQNLKNVQLNWSTASESNNDFFTVQRSNDGIVFNDLVTVLGAGNSHTNLNYTASDNNPYNGISYYKLKLTDYDNAVSFSNLVSVSFTKEFDCSIYPNPFSSLIKLTITDNSQLKGTIFKIYDTNGKIVLNKIISEETTTLDTDRLSKGIYTYQVLNNEIPISKGKLICK